MGYTSMEDFDEWPTNPTVGAYYMESSDGEIYKVEHIYFDDREVALKSLSTGEEEYTFLDIFDTHYEEITDEDEISLILLANTGVDNG